MTALERIRVAAPCLTGNEEAYATEAIRSSWIASTGAYVDRFERDFADLCETRAAIPVANGTLAVHLALVALGIGPGDEVIVPSLTYIATANAVTYTGATPVFADVSPDTWCLDPASVMASVTDRTKGIIPVHLYGHPADMDALQAIADEHGLWIVEDAAEAHGARYKGRRTGGLGNIGVFSFYGNKIVTSGEGGAVTVNDPNLEAKLRLYRGQGMDPERRYFFPVVGYNYRLTNVACAILCAQLERFDEIVAARRRVFERYAAQLSSIPGVGLQPVAPWAEPAPWLYCITVDKERFGRSRDELAALLEAQGIETRPFFIAIHHLPPYERPDSPHLPVTDALAASGLNLPTYVDLNDEDIDRVSAAIKEAGQP
jgi:perosamine synthetase